MHIIKQNWAIFQLVRCGVCKYCKWGRFAGLNFHVFHGFLEYCESFSVNIYLYQTRENFGRGKFGKFGES